MKWGGGAALQPAPRCPHCAACLAALRGERPHTLGSEGPCSSLSPSDFAAGASPHPISAGRRSCSCETGQSISIARVLGGLNQRIPVLPRSQHPQSGAFSNDNEEAEPISEKGQRRFAQPHKEASLSLCSLASEEAGGNFERVNQKMEILTQEKQAYRTTDRKTQGDRKSQVPTLPPGLPVLPEKK